MLVLSAAQALPSSMPSTPCPAPRLTRLCAGVEQEIILPSPGQAGGGQDEGEGEEGEGVWSESGWESALSRPVSGELPPELPPPRQVRRLGGHAQRRPGFRRVEEGWLY